MELARVDVAKASVTTRRKLLIVSSYHRDCGIAQYVEHLELPLRELGTWEIEIAPLPVSVLRSSLPVARQLAKGAVREIAARAAAADVVNIQLEPGLLGSAPTTIWRRLKTILERSNKVVITYHTAPTMNGSRFSFRDPARSLLSLAQQWRANYVFDHLFRLVVANPDKFRHIVHTARERFLFTMLGVPDRTIIDLPLSFLTREVREEASRDRSSDRAFALRTAGIPEGKTIGCFGFISKYKGVETAVKALQFLPDDWHLLIVGGLHPEALKQDSVDQPYLGRLLKLITPTYETRGGADTYKLRQLIASRVHFCGALNNKQFISMMNGCDAVVLPYAEVGQTSSGPASMALDLGKPLYCSRNNAFRELANYAGEAITFFEIGNYLELARKLISGDQFDAERSGARRQFIEAFNVERRADAYLALCEQLCPANVLQKAGH